MGIWALGMESDGAQMIAALDGISPGAPPGTGPQATSASPVAPAGAPPPGAGAPAAGPAPAPGVATSTTPTTAAGGGGTGGGGAGSTTTSAPTTTTTTAAPTITAVRNGVRVVLTPVAASQVSNLTPSGTVTDFETNVPAYACLDGATLDVYWNLLGHATAEAVTPTDCITADFELPS